MQLYLHIWRWRGLSRPFPGNGGAFSDYARYKLWRGTDLKAQFYSYLQALPEDRQVIVVENTDPPEAIGDLEQMKMFGKNPYSGPYGWFPYVPSLGADDEG